MSDAHPSVTVLHISDPQFGEYHRFGAGVESLASHLIYDLRDLLDREVPPVDLIVLSGDIAEKGLRSEYDHARRFIDQLCGQTRLDYERVVVVPGNHDVNWKLCEAYFAERQAEEEEPRKPYSKKWKFFREFVSGLHGAAAFTDEQPYRLHRFEDLRLAVAALNSTIEESHLPDAHYGTCGLEQLRWFEDELRGLTHLARIGVVHHNARRKAQADNENLRDEQELTEVLGPHLDLLLHGHTHDAKQDHLSDGTLVLSTGSTAVGTDQRPPDVNNQYQLIQLRPDGLTRWGRRWDRMRWAGDTGISPKRDTWRVELLFTPPAWEPTESREPEPPWDPILPAEAPRRDDDFISQVEFVTRRDVGEAHIERRVKGHPPLTYLFALRKAAPARCVGIVDHRLDKSTLDRFEDSVFGPLREGGGVELVLVHRGTDDPELRVAAKHRGIRVKTWTEYNDLLEPSAYATWLRGQLDSDPLYPQGLYLPQRFRHIDRLGKQSADIEHDLLSDIYDGMLEEESRFILLLGDAGFGKSFLVRRLAHLMLENHQAAPTPIVIFLRDRDKRQTIDEMVSNVLIPSRATFNADRFQHSLEAGSLALLVDGYDEFAVRVGYTNAAAQLQTFIQAMRGNAKILLTTRPNHFRSTNEATSKLFENLRTVHHGRVYQLEPFDAKQQSAFLTRWFSLRGDPAPKDTAASWIAALAKVDNLPELAKTPRMLSFMVEDLRLDQLGESSSGRQVTAAELYQKLIGRWLSGEASQGGTADDRTVPAHERQRLLEDMALQLWRIGERDVTEETLHGVTRELDLPRYDMTLDQAAQLVGGRTLLQVDEGRWRFAHQSVWEFLLANRLARLLREGEDPDTLGNAELTALTIRFLRDLAPAEAAAWGAGIAGGR